MPERQEFRVPWRRRVAELRRAPAAYTALQTLRLGSVPAVELTGDQALPIALRALRETLNYSQEAWSVLLGVGWRTIMRWEHGQSLPSEHTLVMLRCRLNHGDEAVLWQERLATDPPVFQLLVDIGLIDAASPAR